MRDFFKLKTWLIAVSTLVIALVFSSAIVYYEFAYQQNIKAGRATASDNVSGWAWNANIGWISFNCTDVPKSCGGGSSAGAPCPNGDECSGGNCVDTCSLLSNYGVSIDPATRNFSGYGWSPSVGWVSFQENNAPDYSFNSNCLSNCSSSNSCTACYRLADGKVYGWAKILSLGADGWIKFNDASWPNGVAINPLTGEFSGWAWSPGDAPSIGWISFNCADVPKACSGGSNAGAPCPNGNECWGGGNCANTCTALSNYKVAANININRPPTVIDMTAPNWSYVDAAGSLGALNAKLGWTFSDLDAGDSQSAYRVVVNISDSTDNPLFNSGKCSAGECRAASGGSGTTYFLLTAADGLTYNTAYYWWAQVWDNHDAASALTPYDADQDTDNDDKTRRTFTTYKHEMPWPDFFWSPISPSKGEEVKLISQSKRFNDRNRSANPDNCTDDDNPAGTKCAYLWAIPAGAEFKSGFSGAASTTVIIFKIGGSQEVKLKVTDGDGYERTKARQIMVNNELPAGWREVKPE